MNVRKGIFSTGLLILVAGLVIGVTSFAPSQVIQLVVVVSAFSAGAIAIITGKGIFSQRLASRYILVEGAVLILYAITAALFGSGNISREPLQKSPHGGSDPQFLLQLSHQRLLVRLAGFHVPAEEIPDVRIEQARPRTPTQQNPIGSNDESCHNFMRHP